MEESNEKGRPAIYFNYFDKQEYPCTVLKSTPTQHYVRLPEATAYQLDLAEELWIPAFYIRFPDERR